MTKVKTERRERGNNPMPRAGAFDAAEEDTRRPPPHEAPIIQTEVLPSENPAQPEAEPKRSFIDRLADAFGQIPSARLANYRTLL